MTDQRPLSDACFYEECKNCPGTFPDEIGDYGTAHGESKTCRCKCHSGGRKI
jgi:hypothetical protein